MAQLQNVYQITITLAIIIIYVSGSDKTNKSYRTTCSRLEWKCSNNQCIPIEQKCDGSIDCDDASDESAASCILTKCPPFAFQCTYGACIPAIAECNGIKECADNSDELTIKCSGILEKRNLHGNCSNYQFNCDNGTKCIDTLELCDGTINCADQTDESLQICITINCPMYAFRCGYGACIISNNVCDGKTDCADGSDEIFCKNLNPDLNDTNVQSENLNKSLCGTKNFDTLGIPWHIDVYSNIPSTSNFVKICGGTIITAKFAFSAAHCFWDNLKNKIYNISYFQIGSYSSPSIFYKLSKIIPSTEYSKYQSGDNYVYVGDIALLEIEQEFLFNKNQFPICFESNLNSDEMLTNIEETTLRQTSIEHNSPLVSVLKCTNASKSQSPTFINPNNLCGDYLHQIGVYQNYTGGGLIYQLNDKYYLYGVVSAGSLDQKILFTSIKPYADSLIEQAFIN